MSNDRSSRLDSEGDAVADFLARLAGIYGPDSPLPSAQELARGFGVPSSALGVEELASAQRGARAKQIYVVLEPDLIQTPSASPVWGQVWGMLQGRAEERSADEGQSFIYHMSSTLMRPGSIRDLFLADLGRGRVQAVMGLGVRHDLVQEVNRFRVPVITYGGSGNHIVAMDMHDQVETAVGMLAEEGCRRIELWPRAATGLSPYVFSIYDLLDPEQLINQFRDPYDRAAQRVAARAAADTARRLATFRLGDPITADLRHALAETLNVALHQPSLWDEHVFEDVALREETVRANAARSEGWTAQLNANRLLIQDTFPTAVARGSTSRSDTVNAFLAAMKRMSYDGPCADDFDEPTVRPVGREDGAHVGNQLPGYNLARRVFASDQPRPDGLVIDDDIVASGVHRALEELGVRIGEDVRIVTHANAGSPIGFGLHGRVIQIVFDPADFVAAMFSLLDLDTVNDLERMNVARVQPRIVAPHR